MTQEEKQLVLIDICARLPYGVKIELMPITKGKCTTLTPIILRDYYISDDVNYLPYLRPMSSMTEEEAKEIAILHDIKDILSIRLADEYMEFIVNDGFCSTEKRTIWYDEIVLTVKCFDFLTAHHFDYRGLIEKGLAIEVTKENNPYKEYSYEC